MAATHARTIADLKLPEPVQFESSCGDSSSEISKISTMAQLRMLRDESGTACSRVLSLLMKSGLAPHRAPASVHRPSFSRYNSRRRRRHEELKRLARWLAHARWVGDGVWGARDTAITGSRKLRDKDSVPDQPASKPPQKRQCSRAAAHHAQAAAVRALGGVQCHAVVQARIRQTERTE